MKYIHVSQTNSYSVWILLFFLFWIQILRSKNKIYSYWHTTVRQNNMIWEGICVVFFTWNILLLSYINKIEAVTLKHIKKKKNSTRVLLAPVQKTPPKNKNKKKHTKKSIESQKVLILMIYLLILWILIFVSFFQNNFSTSS